MIRSFRKQASIYAAFAAMVPKVFTAYTLWFWVGLFLQLVSMVIYVYFWRAVYANRATIGGLNFQQTLNYILLAQIFLPMLQTRTIFNFGFLVQSGGVAIELLRPIDFQLRSYIESMAEILIGLVTRIPLLLLAILAFGMRLPANPVVWLVFLVTLFLGHALMFFFDWLFSCLAFYTTETWGLSVVREGVAAFFSGALVPLAMMPGWLQKMADAMPFAQVIAVPVSILSGITPMSQLGQVWLVQLAWLVGLLIASRLFFSIALRKVTVQGG